MAKCANCGSKIMLGGVKTDDPEVRFCNKKCQGVDFLAKFHRSLVANPSVTRSPEPPPKAPAVKDVFDEDVFRPEDAGNGFGASDLMVIVLGLAWAAAFSALTSWICSLISYAFYAQTFWFVLPVGAYLCGMGGGIGFWLTLRMYDRLPNRLTYLAAFVGGAAAYVFIFAFMWLTWVHQGQPVRDHMAFTDFLQLIVENQKVRPGRNGPAIDLGKWGYARFALNLVGYSLGVISSVAIGGGKSYCPNCRRYFKTVGSQVRTSNDPEVTALTMRDVIDNLNSGRIQEAIDLHAGLPVIKKGLFSSTILLEGCPGCGTHKATLAATIQGDQGVEQLADLAHVATTPHAVVMPS